MTNKQYTIEKFLAVLFILFTIVFAAYQITIDKKRAAFIDNCVGYAIQDENAYLGLNCMQYEDIQEKQYWKAFQK